MTIFQDGHNGSISSKRVITFLSFLLCATGFIANLFFGYKMDEFMYNSMMWIVVSGLGFTGLEKFAPKTGTKFKSSE
jgi:hypothetical protein